MSTPTTAPIPPATSVVHKIARPWRRIFLLPAIVCLILALNGALQLLGVYAPIRFTKTADAHGLLMTLGFLGALISLERAVANSRWYSYLAPVALSIGGLLLLTDLPKVAAQLSLFTGSALLTLTYVPLWRRNHDPATLVQLLGAASAMAVPLLLIADLPIRTLVPFLIAFVVLTIAGERLELARITLPVKAPQQFLILATIATLTLFMAWLWPTFGYPILGLSYITMTVFLIKNDVARRLIHTTGNRRFMAACMLAGYFWLTISATMWLSGPAFEGGRYDTLIHAAFLGFAMSMVMAHATVIFPAVSGLSITYHWFFWMPLTLLHLGLILRIWLGNTLEVTWVHQLGGTLNVWALLIFFATVATRAVQASRTAAVTQAQKASK